MAYHAVAVFFSIGKTPGIRFAALFILLDTAFLLPMGYLSVRAVGGEMNYIINSRVQVNQEGMSSVGINEPEIVLTATPKRLLTYLLENPNRIIPREELFRYIWEERGLTPSGTSLSQYLSVIRKNFQRYGLDDLVIENIPKEGIRFNAQVTYVAEITKTQKRIRLNSLKCGSLNVLHKFNEYVYWLFVVLICVIFVLHFIFSKFIPLSDLQYADWVKSDYINQCDIYFPEGEISDEIKKIYTERTVVALKKIRMSCAPTDKVLIFIQNPLNNFNNSPTQGREFIAHCALLKKSYYCHSYYFLHGGDV